MALLRKLLTISRNFFLSNRAYVEEYASRSNIQVDGRFYSQYSGRAEDPLGPIDEKIKPIAFYLPQMHPIPENDLWWGRGFTEWTNVSKAVPRFLGHYQPRLPGELGFYDLRCIEVIERQVELAKLYGLHAFCFYYYWFDGKRLLERPLDLFVEDQSLDIKFCLCWANENWTRRWDGLSSDILINQKHSLKDAYLVFKDWLRYFSDPRYLKVEGRPVVLIYRPDLIPEFQKVSEMWRQEAEKCGLSGLYILGTSAFNTRAGRNVGLDGTYDFPPHSIHAPRYTGNLTWLDGNAKTKVYSYEGAVTSIERKYREPLPGSFDSHPGVLVGWDTEPRKPGRGDVFVKNTPALFRRWLKSAFERASRHANDASRFVFINAWNEWAEGAYLEPDRRHGYAYLAALRSVVREFGLSVTQASAECERHNAGAAPASSDKVVMLHLFYYELIDEFCDLLSEARKQTSFDLVLSLPDVWTLQQVKAALAKFAPRKVYIVKNCGRDVYPFLEVGRLIRGDSYRYGCKIHSKKSTHRTDGDAWRQDLLRKLLSKSALQELEARFFHTSQYGIAAPADAYVPMTTAKYVAGNLKSLQFLRDRFGMGSGRLSGEFIAGTMFWFDFSLFHPLFAAGLDEQDFGPDLGEVDGTLAHALERFFAIYVNSRGGKLLKIVAQQ